MSTYLSHYCSPLGEITIAADDSAVIGVWFDGQAYFKADLNEPCEEIMTPLLSEVITTLDAYFNGEQIEVNFPLHPHGTTYQKEVFALLLNIPYGETCTYGSLAEQYFNMYGRRTSPRAIGSAVSHNPISILIPCHRGSERMDH